MLPCKIKVYTEQQYEFHKDCDERTFKGTSCKKNENTFIIYKEKDLDTGRKITNRLKISKDGSVSVRRMGDMQSTLHFIKDKPYTTFYHTGQGIIELVFKPAVIKHKKTQHGYEIELRYEIYMGESKLSDNIYILKATFLA